MKRRCGWLLLYSTRCGRWCAAALLLAGLSPASYGQGLPGRIEDMFNDGKSFTVYVTNPFNVPLVITGVQIFDCVETGLGCGPGSGASQIRIAPGQEWPIATVTRAGCTNPVDQYGNVITDDCSRRPRTSFRVTYQFVKVESAPGTGPSAPTQPPTGRSDPPTQRAEQERLERERLERERQQRERQEAERKRAEQQRQAEQQRAERERQQREREAAQREEESRRQQAELERQKAERQRRIDQQRAEQEQAQKQMQQRLDELRRQQEQQQRASEARVRAAQDRVNQINQNTARAQDQVNSAFDKLRAMLERDRLEAQQREAQRELERLQEEADQQREDARRELARLQEEARSQREVARREQENASIQRQADAPQRNAATTAAVTQVGPTRTDSAAAASEPIPQGTFAQADAEKFAEGKIALERYRDCAAAKAAFESVSERGRSEAVWMLYAAKTNECLNKMDDALALYIKYNQLVKNRAEITDKIGELRYQIAAARRKEEAEQLRRQREEESRRALAREKEEAKSGVSAVLQDLAKQLNGSWTERRNENSVEEYSISSIEPPDCRFRFTFVWRDRVTHRSYSVLSLVLETVTLDLTKVRGSYFSPEPPAQPVTLNIYADKRDDEFVSGTWESTSQMSGERAETRKGSLVVPTFDGGGFRGHSPHRYTLSLNPAQARDSAERLKRALDLAVATCKQAE